MKDRISSILESIRLYYERAQNKLAKSLSRRDISLGMKHQIQVLQLSLVGKEKMIKQFETDKKEMIAQYQRLEVRLHIIEAETKDNEREGFFRELQAILSEIAVMSTDLKNGLQIPIEEILRVLDTIPEKLGNLEIEQFLKAGEFTEFDPRVQIPVLSEAAQTKTGDRVISIVPGFKYKETVLQKAEVQKVDL